MPIASRPAREEDRRFLLDLYAATRADEFSALGWSPEALRTFLEQQYRAREAGWRLGTPDSDDRVLVRDGHPIGRLVLDRQPDGIRVVDIALLPGEQGRGTGTEVLRGVLGEADAARVPVTLHVVAGNRARRLYERLGFVPVTGDGVHVLMTRRCAERAVAQPNTAT